MTTSENQMVTPTLPVALASIPGLCTLKLRRFSTEHVFYSIHIFNTAPLAVKTNQRRHLLRHLNFGKTRHGSST